jgi:phosphoribosylanthranilate isomerase
MTRVKICGVTSTDEIRLCVEAGASALGFVVEYPLPVPWNMQRLAAQELMRHTPPLVTRVVVVGGAPETVIPVTELLRPHAVQLHGNEPLDVTAELVVRIHALGAAVIKALRFSTETGECDSSGHEPLLAAQRIVDVGVDALLLDSVSANRPAGTGRSIDWTMARMIRDGVRVPVILAGGLHPGNVGQAVSAVAPYAVDVISGVEDSLGRKDPGKVRAFVEAVDS